MQEYSLKGEFDEDELAADGSFNPDFREGIDELYLMPSESAASGGKKVAKKVTRIRKGKKPKDC